MSTVFETRSAETGKLLATTENDPRVEGWSLTNDYVITEVERTKDHKTTEEIMAGPRNCYIVFERDGERFDNRDDGHETENFCLAWVAANAIDGKIPAVDGKAPFTATICQDA